MLLTLIIYEGHSNGLWKKMQLVTFNLVLRKFEIHAQLFFILYIFIIFKYTSYLRELHRRTFQSAVFITLTSSLLVLSSQKELLILLILNIVESLLYEGHLIDCILTFCEQLLLFCGIYWKIFTPQFVENITSLCNLLKGIYKGVKGGIKHCWRSHYFLSVLKNF